jgi:hypothetical protein
LEQEKTLENNNSNHSKKSSTLIAVIALLVSFAAVGMSGYTLWDNILSPFKLEVSAGSPLLAMASEGEGSAAKTLCMILPVDMVNTGARGGIVEDLLIRLDTDSPEFPFWYLRPYFFPSEFSTKAITETERELVHPLYFLGKERLFRNILFTTIWDGYNPYPTYIEGKSQIPSGNYTVTLFVLDSSNPEFRQVDQFSFYIPPEGGVIIPSDVLPLVPHKQEVMDARQRLFELMQDIVGRVK